MLVQVLQVVRQSLHDLRLAIEGTIIMSTSLKDMLDAMYDARVPERWLKVRLVYLSSSCLVYVFMLDLGTTKLNLKSTVTGVMGVEYTRVLVYGAAGERCSVSAVVHPWPPQSLLDHWLLQSSGISHCHETGRGPLLIHSFYFTVPPICLLQYYSSPTC